MTAQQRGYAATAAAAAATAATAATVTATDAGTNAETPGNGWLVCQTKY